MGAASMIGVSRLEPWGDRLRASVLPAESAPANITKYIDEKRRAMKQSVLEVIAFFGKVEFGLLQESPLV